MPAVYIALRGGKKTYTIKKKKGKGKEKRKRKTRMFNKYYILFTQRSNIDKVRVYLNEMIRGNNF